MAPSSATCGASAYSHRAANATVDAACTLGRAGFEELLAQGMTRAETARALGYKTQGAITYHFKRLGVNAGLHTSATGG
jgi:hypothetical protein